MSIQFACTNCGQPIEVDDEHAGESAACPYCHHVVTVPQESTYKPEAAVPARPATGSPHPAAGGYGADLGAERGRRLGSYGLICTGITIVLLVIASIVAGYMIASRPGGLPQGKMSNEQMEKLMVEIGHAPAIQGLSIAAFVAALVGLTFGVVSVSQARAGNWRGWLALVVCGAYVVCNCATPLLIRPPA